MKYLTNISVTAGFFGLWISCNSAVYGEPIYSQVTPGDPTGAFSSNDIPTGQKVADNFSLQGDGPVTVRSVRFIGGYGLTAPPPITPPLNALPDDNFRIVFFEDGGDVPGQPLVNGDFLVSKVFQRAPTNGQLLNGAYTPLEYKINLRQGITIDPETPYWISILNNVEPDHGWTWARAEGLFDSETSGTRADVLIGPWSSFDNGGMFFELDDQRIPEPTSLVVFLIGFGTFVSSLGRRRKHR